MPWLCARHLHSRSHGPLEECDAVVGNHSSGGTHASVFKAEISVILSEDIVFFWWVGTGISDEHMPQSSRRK